MKRRLSIGQGMAWIVLIGVNFAVMRSAFRGSARWAIFAFVFLPSASLLVVAALRVVRGLWARGDSGPFTFGYLMVGIVASMIATLTFHDYESMNSYMKIVLGPLDRLLRDFGPTPAKSVLWAVMYPGVVFAFVIPQVVPALFGGWAARRLGLSIVVRGREGCEGPVDAD